ncbi:MAG: hypothetical protein R8N24_02360 [Alphaproteobacteria bacterium]|nr:hypothetical protein [Alphaproteobacteria bacterium]
MGFLSIFTESAVIMTLIAFICAVLAIRCLLYGLMGGTSTILRLIGTLAFIGLAYYFWRYSSSLHGANIIDQFVSNSWREVKSLLASIM